MKGNRLYVVALALTAMLALLLFGGCNDDDDLVMPADNVLIIGLEAGFVSDSINVTVNGTIVLDELVSTDMTISMAKVFDVAAPHGGNRLTVSAVDERMSADTSVFVGGNTFVLVALERTPAGVPNEFRIVISDTSLWQGRD